MGLRQILPWQTKSILINAKISFQVTRFAAKCRDLPRLPERLPAGTFCHEKWLKWQNGAKCGKSRQRIVVKT